ncbi:MAG: hypothetical protein LBR11_11335 [Deltaproteobacteria bacterium]|jgi:hypothetical protein|nr:hypothetical protein [Deltaproteobacteria bacterium]
MPLSAHFLALAPQSRLCLLSLILGLALLSTAPLGASELDQISPEQLAEEPPLNQQDIDLFLRFFNPQDEMRAELYLESDSVVEAMDKYALDFAGKNNITLVHLAYIAQKIPVALFYALDNSTEIAADFKPNEEEARLLLANQAKILERLTN